MWSPLGWDRYERGHNMDGDRYERGHYMDGDRYERGHHMDGTVTSVVTTWMGPLRVWSPYGRWTVMSVVTTRMGTVTSVVTTWMGTVTTVVTTWMRTVTTVVTTWLATVTSVVTTLMGDGYELSFASVLRFVSEIHYAQSLKESL